jgi:hypothetical protein
MNFSPDQILGKSYRILALGALLFLLGVGTFFYNRDPQPSERRTATVSEPAIQPSVDDVLRGYPAPERFLSFTYSADLVKQDNVLNLKGECAAEYFTVIIFQKGFDYRKDPSRSVFNRAVVCPEDKKINYNIFFHDLVGLLPTDYYVILADQHERGIWYNPR